MRLQSLLYIAAACVGSAGAAWLVATFAVASVEADTEARTEQSFQAAGIDWATATANGLRLELTGTAESESSRVRMLETVAQVVNTSRIVDQTKVERLQKVEAPNFSLEILRNERDLSLIGLIPGTQGRIDVLRAVGDIRDPNTFSDFMEAVDYPAPDGWDDALGFALRLAPDLAKSHIVVRPGGLEIEAFLSSQSEKEAVRARISARVPDGVQLRMDLRAPKAVVSPFVFEAALNGNDLSVTACNADTERAQGRIYSALSDFGVETDCDLALGTASEDWGRAVVEVLGSLKRMGGGSVRIEDADITITAPLGMDPTAFAVEESKMLGNLPDMFSVAAVLPSKPQPRVITEQVPPQLDVALLEDGQVTLSAPMRNALALEATRNFAAARFGSGRVEAELRLDETVPEGWAGRVLATLDAVSMLHAGEAQLTETALNIFGVTGHADGIERINALLAERLDGIDVTADIAYDDTLIQIEEVITLSDDDCERALASIMRDFQITFAPSSATIDDSSNPVIDEISAVLKSCPDATFEIGGHTDSQGRESMNLGLSQARAEAVMDALLNRDVLLGNLSAKGYGEAEPIADNGTEEGRAANRRIAFKLVVNEETPDADAAADEETSDEQN